MTYEPKAETVSGALADLMDMEQDRLELEDQELKARQQEERKAREAEEKAAREAEAKAAREAEQARLAKIKAEQDEIEAKRREKELAEIELRKKLEMEGRLKEEELRMKHEQQLRSIEAKEKKGLPKWGWAAMAGVVLLLASGTVGAVLYMQNKAAKEQDRIETENALILAARQAEKKEKDKQFNDLLEEIDIIKKQGADNEDARARLAELEAKRLAFEQDSSQPTKPKKKKKKKKKKPTTTIASSGMNDPIAGLD